MSPNRRAVVQLGGARAVLLVPLLKNEAILGYITIYRKEVRRYSDKQIGLLQKIHRPGSNRQGTFWR